MTRPVIWRCPCSGRQHLATLSDSPDESQELRTLCGLTGRAVRPVDVVTDGAVTCDQCRTEEEIAALVKYLAA
jgi:hypothetical protein